MSASPRYGLSTLSAVPLAREREELLSALAATSQGSAVWRARKLVEARELCALESIAARLAIVGLDLTTDLLAFLRLRVPVPCKPPDDAEITIAGEADIVLCYPEQILRGPLPGYALVQIPRPQYIWHSNVSADGAQRLCLGANVPKGLPLREAVLGCYAALSLQSITLDAASPAGVMNPVALSFWNEHLREIPLSAAPFIDAPQPGQHERPAVQEDASR